MPKGATGDALITLREAAERLGLTVACLRRWRLLRRLEVVKLGRAVRVRPEELNRLVREGTVPARERGDGR